MYLEINLSINANNVTYLEKSITNITKTIMNHRFNNAFITFFHNKQTKTRKISKSVINALICQKYLSMLFFALSLTLDPPINERVCIRSNKKMWRLQLNPRVVF